MREMYFDEYGWPNPRRADGPKHLTPEDWSQGRRATGTGSRYRWVDPKRDNCTKEDWPYSYSEHYVLGTAAKGDDAAYSDRLQQWSQENWERAWKVIGNRRFDQFSFDDANKFMSAYFDKPTKVSAIAEGCNVGNGYPYWVLWFSHITSSRKP